MAFSVTCPKCKRSFADIDDSMLWQKAKCRCGDVVELVPDAADPSLRQADVKSTAKPRRSQKTKQSRRPSTYAKSSSPIRKPAANKSNDLVEHKSSPKAELSPKVAETPKQTDKQDERAFTPDNFADLDSILASGVDHSPLDDDRPWASPAGIDSIAASPPSLKPATEKSKTGRNGSIIAAIAGLLTATLVLSTRYTEFRYTPLGWIGQTLYGAQHASFGTGEMSDMCVNTFTWLGWLLVLLSFPLIIFSLLLFVRAAVRGRKKRRSQERRSQERTSTVESRLFPWARGGLATVSVVCLFALLGMAATQSIHHHQVDQSLDEFQAPIEGLMPDEDLANVKVLRDKYASENRTFIIGAVSFALFPLVTFAGSIVSLFFDEK